MLLLALLLATAAPPPSSHCLPITAEREGPVNLTGRLERHVYPGPPNYENIRGGDRAEPTYILVLDRPICLNEETVIPARAPIRRVQLYTGGDAMWPRLRAAVGHRIQVSGTGFGAITAHHREPLVVDVASLQIRR